MSNINALIAAGPHTRGLDAQSLITGVQQARNNDKRNALLDIKIADEPARIARMEAQEGRLQSQENRLQKGFETKEQLRQGIGLSQYLESGDIPGAIAFVSRDGISENEIPTIEMLKRNNPEEIATLKGTLKNLIQTGYVTGDLEQPQGAKPTKRTQLTNDGKYEFMVDANQQEIPGTRFKIEGSKSDEGGNLTYKNIPNADGSQQSVALDEAGNVVKNYGTIPRQPTATEIKTEDEKKARGAAERKLVTKMEMFAEVIGNERFSHVVGPRDAGWTSRAIGKAFDTDDSRLFRRLEQMSGKEVLELGGEVLKGSQTEGEWERVALAMPLTKDHEGTWAQWYSDAIRTIVSGAPQLAPQLEPIRRAIAQKYGVSEGQVGGQLNSGDMYFDENGNVIP